MKPVDVAVSTPFGISGPRWTACRRHTGDDLPVSSGTRLVAAISGTIRHRNYGSAFGNHQFAISPSEGQPFADGEVFYAHTRTRLPDGTEVRMGDFVAESGAEGNVSGPHLHFEFHPHSKNVWNCDVVADPQPVYDLHEDHGHDSQWSSGDVWQDRLVPGQEDSDSVRRLQWVLNQWSFKGGVELPITGLYGPQTASEVAKFQTQVCGDAGDGAIGPRQTDKLFTKGGPWNIHR
jgi:murein DD-endopeptidase MepM/ murein hydrolase activator NlpD